MKVALPFVPLTGKERQGHNQTHGSRPCSSEASDVGPTLAQSLIRIILLVGVFAALITMLPLHAQAADNGIPPLSYEIRDPVVPGSLALAPFTLPPPQWRSVEQMTKSERRAMLVQMAAEVVAQNSTISALKDVWMAVREPIRSEDGSMSCKTKLSFNTYFMRCSLKF